MPNRSKWAHWKRPKPERHPLLKKASVGIACIVVGGLLLLAGLQGLGDHAYWYTSFDFRFGKPVIHETLDLILLGGISLLAGIAILILRE